MFTSITDPVLLAGGVKMPCVGLGVFQVEKEEELNPAVKAALEAGYRHIDTAAIYGNEEFVGRAMAQYGKRDEIFLTSKLWNDRHSDVAAAYEESLKKLGTDHLELYLIHWPSPKVGNFIEAWKGMVDLLEKRKVRAIGVSNFTPEHIEKIIDSTGVTPAVNQVERHPLFQQKELQEYLLGKGIVPEAYAPLTSGHLPELTPKIQPIAAKHGKTVAQVILRWQLQTGWVIIPKSITPSRIQENADLFGFTLDNADLAAIAALDEGKRLFPNPDTADF